MDKLTALCRNTNWTTYKIWQAVKAGDLAYTPVTFIIAETPLRDALKHMLLKETKFAVIKKGKREVGMVGEQRLRETLNRQSQEYQEETKDAGYFDILHGKF